MLTLLSFLIFSGQFKSTKTFIKQTFACVQRQTIHVSEKLFRFNVFNFNFVYFFFLNFSYGIGSETRNALHHLHSSPEIIILTTCKHGKKWQELRDERCDHDNQDYDS